MGTHHYKVLKEENEEGTLSHMKELNEQQRIEEIAQMLSGSDITPAALANAKDAYIVAYFPGNVKKKVKRNKQEKTGKRDTAEGWRQ